MDLFNKKLSLDEAIQLDSIIDNGNYEPHLVLYAGMLDKPEFQASEEETKSILSHLNNKNVQSEQHVKNNVQSEQSNIDNNNVENKKQAKRYIALPNATIQLHKHKFKQVKTGQDNEARKSRKRGK